MRMGIIALVILAMSLCAPAGETNMPEVAELQKRVHDLEKEITRLTAQMKTGKHGLTWVECHEQFEDECESKIPILAEVPEKAIVNKDGKPTHILIEGDNYHALTCLNFTHLGKIDVIYIDPPYNTGSDGFTYKDRRYLEKFPDGTPVPKDHPLRHSYWLSFMDKRLRLAKELLSDRGVIFISIDDNEMANLKLLCDKIFGEDNFVANLIWKSTPGSNTGSDIKTVTEYVLLYSRKRSKCEFGVVDNRRTADKYVLADEYAERRGKYVLNKLDRRMTGQHYSDALNYPIQTPQGKELWPGGLNRKQEHWNWRWSKEKVKWGVENGFIVFKETPKKCAIYFKQYQYVDNTDSPITRYVPYQNLILDTDGISSARGTQEIMRIFSGKVFSYPKPLKLIIHLLSMVKGSNVTVLDFFAGSGTTGHAVMCLNAKDGGSRQFILVQQKDGANNICEAVTYERNKRIIVGYKNAKGEQQTGLGGSLKYYKAEFVGKHGSATALDDDRAALAAKAGALLSLAEGTLESEKVAKEAARYWQHFSDGAHRHTLIYFSEDLSGFASLVETADKIRENDPAARLTVYIFSIGGDVKAFENEFDDTRNITPRPIPEPILQIYRAINEG